MAHIIADRVKETTTTEGTGAYTLAGAADGFQSFAAVGDANECFFAVENGTDWEVCRGVYTASGTTLTRAEILASSNSGSAVNWSTGTKNVFLTMPAGRAVLRDDAELRTPTIADSDGATVVVTAASPHSGTPVNYIECKPAPANQHPRISATGSDSNVSLTLEGKGTGSVLLDNGRASNTFTFANTSYGNLNLTAQDGSQVTAPTAGDIYLDDGTNTGTSAVGFRYYTGSAWQDLPTSSGGGGGGTWTADQNSDGYGIDDTNGNELLHFTTVASATNFVRIKNNTANPTISADGPGSTVTLELAGKNGGGVRVNDDLDVDGQIEFNTLKTTAASSEPSSPETGEIYLDDGSNRTDSYIGFRYYDGSEWIDIPGTGMGGP